MTPRKIERGTPEHDRIMEDWHKFMPRRVVDPERHEREIREWDESREREQRERDRVSELWRRRRERWDRHNRGDTSPVPGPIPPGKEG
jgi:hypothetical protein